MELAFDMTKSVYFTTARMPKMSTRQITVQIFDDDLKFALIAFFSSLSSVFANFSSRIVCKRLIRVVQMYVMTIVEHI